jgi:DNA polymerase-3 subunit delta
MQLDYEQLLKHLKSGSVSPIYLIAGEDVFLAQEASALIRMAAKKTGFLERQVVYIEDNFNWSLLASTINHYGLFSEKLLLEVHLLQDIQEKTAAFLKQYAKNPSPHKLLLIIAHKMDYRVQKSSWFKDLNPTILFVYLRPFNREHLTQWIIKRCATRSFNIEKEAVEYLVFATEGNLLITAQVIEKLALYIGCEKKVITLKITQLILNDSAHFDHFKLSNTALAGKPQSCLRILARLKAEKTEPLLILWALARECRQLASLAFGLSQGKTLTVLFREQFVLKYRQALLQQALARHPLVHWYALLKWAFYTDQLAKVADIGDIWCALKTLSLGIAGPFVIGST